ncbi:Glycosyl transferase group 1 [Candidatus Nitrotoga fabula]|uniref:Glycosyl transferase group 1 n=2 Tax=Candidatus Nitrotoga fabula TaxID=2182327 RepID=A0A916BF78_9PROT|nr:Glycosyl transferase group 1 [Candidatus Nitrotoga fabula]
MRPESSNSLKGIPGAQSDDKPMISNEERGRHDFPLFPDVAVSERIPAQIEQEPSHSVDVVLRDHQSEYWGAGTGSYMADYLPGSPLKHLNGSMEQEIPDLMNQFAVEQHNFERIKARLAASEQRTEAERRAKIMAVDRMEALLEAQRNSRQEVEMRLAQLEKEHSTLSARLDDANCKYRTATIQISSLKKRVQESETLVQVHKREVTQLKERQISADNTHARLLREKEAAEQDRKHDVAALSVQAKKLESAYGELQLRFQEADEKLRAGKEEIVTLKNQLACAQNESEASKAELLRKISELETSNALLRSAQYQSDQLKLQVLQTKKSLTDLHGKVESLRQQKIAQENQIAKIHAMLSFQLGYRLLHGFKSFRAFIQLPKHLIELRREAKRRKAAKAETLTFPASLRARVNAIPDERVIGPVPDFHLPATLALLNSCVALSLKSLKVACIMDEFTFGSYCHECNLLQLSVQNWQTELETFTPELLFIESAWRGKDDQWGGKVGHMSDEVVGIVGWCRQRKIPSVFWNKEDPIHFETFLSTAKLFDFVFTTDIDCIHRYKAALGHDRVYLLPFACQPEASNPIEVYQRKDAFCFAGAYYVRYPERTRDLGNFMTALAEYRPVEIYDRNYGKGDPNHQFPAEYQPFIVGSLPFDQIDKAYKGSRYAINLNSIKQSQSMFARRVFDLLACNTITVSNFSRGVRLLFGDLVITTDNGDEIVRRLQALGSDETQLRKFRLAGLRKVMMNHTYQDRLAYIVSRVQGKANPKMLPRILVTAYAKNQIQFDALCASFNRQSHPFCRLIVVVPREFTPGYVSDDQRMQVLVANTIQNLRLEELTGSAELVAGMVPDDYYGPNYLLDLALATRYSSARGIGKVTHYVWSASKGMNLAFPGCQYTATAKSIPARCALLRPELVSNILLSDWVTTLYPRQIVATDLLAIDEFNYCKNGGAVNFGSEQAEAVNDLAGLDHGFSTQDMIVRAERITPEEAAPDEAPVLSGNQLASFFKPPTNKEYAFTVSGSVWEAVSSLPDGTHDYMYAATEHRPIDLGFETNLRLYLDVTPGLNIQLVILFLDAKKQRISHVIKTANRNHDATIPHGAEWIRFGIRIYGSGTACINGLVLGHRPLRPSEILSRGDYLLLTNHYPSDNDLYRNGFVHSRVTAYAEQGIRVDVFRLRNGENLSYHEFHNIDVITGSQEALHKLLRDGNHRSVLVHFLDAPTWDVLQHYVDRVKVFVWVHGAEIQPWHRRDNFENQQQREAAKVQSEARMSFWRGVLKQMPENLKLVFVSKYLAEVTMEDLGFRLPGNGYRIIHNAINTDLFAYHKKPVEQRKKILSIRPYASRTYANDLSVQAILALSEMNFFKDLEFHIIGDGKLFDDVLAPLRGFSNVCIERRFLTQASIAQLHREYGIFLCPSRMDTQGVSRDEAMSSGLIPVTNAVAAIPEFVDKSSGILAPGEDALALAKGIERLYNDPDLFATMSFAAAQRVRQQSSKQAMICAELQLFHHKAEA